MRDVHLDTHQLFIPQKNGVRLRFPCPRHQYHYFTAGSFSLVLSKEGVRLVSPRKFTGHVRTGPSHIYEAQWGDPHPKFHSRQSVHSSDMRLRSLFPRSLWPWVRVG